MPKHDPTVDTVLIRYPADHPLLPSAEYSIHPANGRTSVQNARGVHPDAAIMRWERDAEPFTEGDPDNGEEVHVNTRADAKNPDATTPGAAPLDPAVIAAVVPPLTEQDNAAHAPDAGKRDQPVTPAVVADAIAGATEPSQP